MPKRNIKHAQPFRWYLAQQWVDNDGDAVIDQVSETHYTLNDLVNSNSYDALVEEFYNSKPDHTCMVVCRLHVDDRDVPSIWICDLDPVTFKTIGHL